MSWRGRENLILLSETLQIHLAADALACSLIVRSKSDLSNSLSCRVTRRGICTFMLQTVTLGVQVPNIRILAQNLVYNDYYPKPRNLIIGYLDLLGYTGMLTKIMDPQDGGHSNDPHF